jgi:NADP-dependent 3-hydroxy acid dehydrogenase YdfG
MTIPEPAANPADRPSGEPDGAPHARSPFTSDLLEGKRVLITGGGTGLGRGVAKHLVAHGARVHLWGRREGVLKEAADEAAAGRPGRVHVHPVDVRRFN